MTHDDEDLTYLHEIGTGGLISLSILSFVNAKVLWLYSLPINSIHYFSGFREELRQVLDVHP